MGTLGVQGGVSLLNVVVGVFLGVTGVGRRGARDLLELAAAQRPNGQEVVTAGADETLRFWKVWNDDAAAARAAPRESVFSSPLSSVR